MKPERTMTELVAAIRGGDQDAFTELYNRTSQEVYRTARAVLRDEDEALDVQQDTFVYAYRHLDQLGDPEKVRPWLRAIAVNRAKTLLRRNSPVLFTELENDEGEGLPEQADLSLEASPELSLERKETAELVNEILGELSDGQRAAIAMYYYEQMSVNEVADSLGVAPSTVKKQLIRGRKKIEDAVRALEKQGVKLYGLSPVAFLVALMKKQAPTAQAGEAVLAKTLVKAGIAAGTKTAAAGAGAAAVPMAETVVLHATRPFFSTVVGKLVLGVLCAGVVGGGVAGYNWAKDKLAPKVSPILYVDSAENLVKDPTEPTLPVELNPEDLTAPTLPVELETTAPVASETTEPVVPETEPEETEPEESTQADNECGESLSWSFDSNYGKLTITGSGAMYDYADAEDVPWREFRENIFTVVLPDDLTEIGKNAFAHCENLDKVKIPEGVTRIGDAAFLDCPRIAGYSNYAGNRGSEDYTAYAMIFIPDSVVEIGEQAFPVSDSTERRFAFFGSENSAAARYASENGNAFEPVTVLTDVDLILEQLRKDQTELGAETRLSYFKTVGDRCLTRLVHVDPITLTEEEIQNAKQSGVLRVNGKDYTFTDSREEANELGSLPERSEQDPEPAGWIMVVNEFAKRNPMTPVLRRDDGLYVVRYYDHENMYWSSNSFTSLGWIWLSVENVNSYNAEYVQKNGLEQYLDVSGFPKGLYHLLQLDDEGKMIIDSRGGY